MREHDNRCMYCGQIHDQHIHSIPELTKEHAVSALIDVVAHDLKLNKDRREKNFSSWKLLFYMKQDNEKLMVFKTDTGFAMSIKGGGHPIVTFNFEEQSNFNQFIRNFLRKAGYKYEKRSKTGMRFYIP